MLRARSDRNVFFTRPEGPCLSEAEVSEAIIAVVEVEASAVAAVATTTSEGEAAAAAISGVADEEDLDEVVEALINFKIKDLRNVSSVSRFQTLTSFAVEVESGSGLMLLASLMVNL